MGRPEIRECDGAEGGKNKACGIRRGSDATTKSPKGLKGDYSTWCFAV